MVAKRRIKAPNATVGDVVFFQTTTWRGQLVRFLQTGDAGFTHVGIVVANERGIEIAHASPLGPRTVQIEPLDRILTAKDVTGCAVYHAAVTDAEAARAARIATDYALRRIPFDFDFDLSNDSAVYCTELVWLSYRSAGLRLPAYSGILFPADLLKTDFFERNAPSNHSIVRLRRSTLPSL